VIWQIEPITAWTWPATSEPRFHRFTASWTDTLDLLERELGHLGVRGAVAIQAFVKPGDVRRDGMLRATARPSKPGVALSFTCRSGPLTFPCDTYESWSGSKLTGWQANLRAIALSLEALRAVDRHGVSRTGEQYVGWRAIESGAATAGFASADEALRWLESLAPALPLKSMLRVAAKMCHPDNNGGDASQWGRYESARRLLEASRG
jgi:hypothetical protein